ncbi:MAG: hypothetical protein Kow0047_22960 [Anaerolineae bacterium]
MALPTEIQVIEISAEQDQHVPHSRSIEPAATTAQERIRGNLYIYLDVSGRGAGRARVARETLSIIQETYYEATGSVNRCLTEAILAAHEAIREERGGFQGCVACLVVRGRDLFVAQAGPAVAFIAHPDAVNQFPSELPEKPMLLGGDEAPPVETFQTRLNGDTTVILADAEWLEHVPAKILAALPYAPEIQDSIDYLQEVADETSLSCLMVRIATQPEIIGGLTEEEEEWEEEAPAEEWDDEATEADAEQEDVMEAPRPSTTPRVPRSVPPIQKPRPASRGPREDEAKVTPPPPKTVTRRARPQPREIPAPPPPAPAPTTAPRGGRWALILAIVIPVLIAALVAAIYWQRGAARNEQFRSLIEEAQSRMVAAEASNDPARSRELLDQAYTILDEAELLRPNDPEVERLRLKIHEQLDTMEQVQPLYLVFTLKEFSQGAREPASVAVNGKDVFVLDRGLDQIDHYRLNDLGDAIAEESPEPLLKKGLIIQGRTVGELIDIAWVPAGNGRSASALLALDANGNLWQWAENLGLGAIPISATDTWRYVQKIDTYFGRLYLMDTQANTILRYTPTDDGYSAAPEPYFAPEIAGNVELGGAVDFSIDGNVWILFADGRVLRFFQGKPQPFELRGYPGRLRDPVALVAGLVEGSATDRLYVGDASDGRIVEFDKTGQFIRQLRPSDASLLRDMRSLVVDETDRQFYILTDHGLFKAQIPPATP